MLVYKRLLLFCSFFVLFSFLFCCYKKRKSVKSKRWCQDNVQRNLWFTASSVFFFILKLATLSQSFLGSFQSGSLSVGWFVSFQRQVCSIFLMILCFFSSFFLFILSFFQGDGGFFYFSTFFYFTFFFLMSNSWSLRVALDFFSVVVI